MLQQCKVYIYKYLKNLPNTKKVNNLKVDILKVENHKIVDILKVQSF